MNWTAKNIPDLTGKKIIVTGANSGLGYYTSLELARKNAMVIMACRNTDKAKKAESEIRQEVPEAKTEIRELDLADLQSVKAFADLYAKEFNQLDVLINNAGLMAIPESKTRQGFEMQFGTNHLGHFALTGKLFSLLKKTNGSRVVTLSSLMYKRGKINFDDLNLEHKYDKWKAYGQSKLANLMFALELDRRIKKNGLNVISIGAHPGYSSTNLQIKGPEMTGSGIMAFFMKIVNALFAQSPQKGVLPQLYAAAADGLSGGEYIGPGGTGNIRGFPEKEKINWNKVDMDVAKKLWEVSEELTGVPFDFTTS